MKTKASVVVLLIIEILVGIGSTVDCLNEAVNGESYEWNEMYPTFAKEARAEGLQHSQANGHDF